MRKHFIDYSYTPHGHTPETVGESKYFGVTISNNLTWTIHTEMLLERGIEHSASYAETWRIALLKWKQPLTSLWFVQPWMHNCSLRPPPSERYQSHWTSSTLSSNTRWATNSSGKALWPEEETIDSLCAQVGWYPPWQLFITVRDKRGEHRRDTKKELEVRPTIAPFSHEQSGTGTCYHIYYDISAGTGGFRAYSLPPGVWLSASLIGHRCTYM